MIKFSPRKLPRNKWSPADIDWKNIVSRHERDEVYRPHQCSKMAEPVCSNRQSTTSPGSAGPIARHPNTIGDFDRWTPSPKEDLENQNPNKRAYPPLVKAKKMAVVAKGGLAIERPEEGDALQLRRRLKAPRKTRTNTAAAKNSAMSSRLAAGKEASPIRVEEKDSKRKFVAVGEKQEASIISPKESLTFKPSSAAGHKKIPTKLTFSPLSKASKSKAQEKRGLQELEQKGKREENFCSQKI
ncbi:hypothetical protein HPP92_019960 [Vanilla planifolia]|uniref:Uncharacterized protein n=1 Tax=Vanilla planifolia TaxID=51239 RepID=A0A835Q7V3_VANPL|nr:hypothetical protein HPP92_019960 [Vanilla planifolia]